MPAQFESCPRCGGAMGTEVYPSRYLDKMICAACCRNEAELDVMNNPLPVSRWVCNWPKRPPFDLKALSFAEVNAHAEAQVPELCKIFQRWVSGTEQSADALRKEALETIPGLTEIWFQPLMAAFDTTNYRVLLHFRRDGDDGMYYTIISSHRDK